MLQIEFIPLKTPDGITCGHARVRDGAVDVHLRAAVRGQAVVLTDAGLVGGDARAHIRANGRVRAVALEEQGALRCCGFARNETLTPDDLRRRLLALSRAAPNASLRSMGNAPPALADDGGPYDEGLAAMQALRRLNAETAPAVAPPRQARAGEAFLHQSAEDAPYVPIPRVQTPPPEAAARASAPADAAPPKASVMAPIEAPREAPIKAPIEAPCEAPPEAPLEAPTETPLEVPIKVSPKTPTPAPPAASAEPDRLVPASDTASFEALCARYDALAADIRRVSPAYSPSAPPEASFPAEARQTRVIRTPIQNPFPHIFPNARFYREEGAEAETLLGTWQRGNERMRITAVLGDYTPQPPEHLEGFTRYIRSRSGGYWVRVD